MRQGFLIWERRIGKTEREADVIGRNDGTEARGEREVIRGSRGVERGKDACGKNDLDRAICWGKKWRVDRIATEGRGVGVIGVSV